VVLVRWLYKIQLVVIAEPVSAIEYCASGHYDVVWLTRFRIRCLWLDFEHGHFTPYCISLQQAESLAKCPLTLKIAQFTPSFTCCSQLNYSYRPTLRERQMSNSVPVVVLRVQHKRSIISRPQDSNFQSRYTN